MTRVLIISDPNTLVWLELPLPAAELVRAARGDKWLPPQLAGYISPGMSFGVSLVEDTVIIYQQEKTLPDGRERHSKGGETHLSLRQRQVLQGIVQGLTTKEIARNLGVSPRTVLFHLAAVKSLTGCQTRAELVRQAIELGMLGSSSQTGRQSSYRPNLPPSPSE
jgi:DNA-binding CsgD family transcriptional regulator